MCILTWIILCVYVWLCIYINVFMSVYLWFCVFLLWEPLACFFTYLTISFIQQFWGLNTRSLFIPIVCFLCDERFAWASIVRLSEERDCISFTFVGVLYLDRLSPICLISYFFFFYFLAPTAEFSAKTEDKDGNSLAFQLLAGAKVTILASKTSRESDKH